MNTSEVMTSVFFGQCDRVFSPYRDGIAIFESDANSAHTAAESRRGESTCCARDGKIKKKIDSVSFEKKGSKTLKIVKSDIEESWRSP
jgi:hypothetical protein